MLIAKRKKPTEKATCCMTPTIWQFGKGKRDSKNISDCLGFGVGREEEWIAGAQQILGAVELFCIIL